MSVHISPQYDLNSSAKHEMQWLFGPLHHHGTQDMGKTKILEWTKVISLYLSQVFATGESVKLYPGIILDFSSFA